MPSSTSPSPSPASSRSTSSRRGSNPNNSIVANRSKLKEFLTSIALIRGDLSNITAPPFVLDTKSAVELPAFWAERPGVFVAPAFPAGSPPSFLKASPVPDEAKRALLVLRWFLSSLRGQQYAGRDPIEGVKKPLNSFLGEIFTATWEDGQTGTTRIVSEQVSHHPPVTACRVWNEKHGVYAEGYTRQEVTLSGVSVNVKQIGHATLTLTKHGDETYLIPLPSVKVKGVLSGTPYPELNGTFRIPSTNGYMSSIDFSGKGFFDWGGDEKKHAVVAKLYKEGDEENPLFTISGNWDTKFVIKEESTGEVIETYDVTAHPPTPLQTDPIDEQDPWESHVAWRGVREALERGDMAGTSEAKNVVEQGQREMRKDEKAENKTWESVFFEPVQEDDITERLASKVGMKVDPKETVALWRFNAAKWERGVQKPYHGDLRPENTKIGGTVQTQQQTNGTQHTHREIVAEDKSAKRRSSSSLANVISSSRNGSIASVNSRRSSKASSTGLAETKVNPVMSPEQQRKENQIDRKLNSGVEGMTLQDKMAVEDMLRNQYSTRGSAR